VNRLFRIWRETAKLCECPRSATFAVLYVADVFSATSLITLPIPRLHSAAAGRQVRRQRLRTATDNLLERILDMQSETDMVVTRLRGPFTEFFRHEK